MSRQVMDREAREDLHARLSARWPEIEQAVLTRVFTVDDPSESLAEPEYAEGLRAAVSASLNYGLAALKLGEERSPPVPPVLLIQTRVAARAGVSLDTVLRRCFAGHALFTDFIVEEAEAGGHMERTELQSPLRIQATIFDRLIATVSEEYAGEEEQLSLSTQQRNAKRIERLLAGELIDTAELDYRLGDCHLGAIAKGPGAVDGPSAGQQGGEQPVNPSVAWPPGPFDDPGGVAVADFPARREWAPPLEARLSPSSARKGL